MISKPIDLAVPAIILKAASLSTAFKSFFLVSTISITCFFVTFPTFSLLGTPEPLAILAAFFSRTAAGGDFNIKLKERSA